MLLFQKRFHEGLVRGDVRLTFRRWDKPHVKPKGRYRCHPIGVLEVDAVARVRVDAISDADAVLSGFATVAELLEDRRPRADGPPERAEGREGRPRKAQPHGAHRATRLVISRAPPP